MSALVAIAPVALLALTSWASARGGVNREDALVLHAMLPYLSRTRARGRHRTCDEVQDLVQAVKDGEPRATRTAARTMALHPRLRGFGGLVVPAPRSSDASPSLQGLAEELVHAGVGRGVASLVRRRIPVPSSRLRRREGLGGLGPAAHAESLAVELGGLPPDTPLLLVDDVIVTGATLAGVVSALRAAGHAGPILGAGIAIGVADAHGSMPVRFCPKKPISMIVTLQRDEERI